MAFTPSPGNFDTITEDGQGFVGNAGRWNNRPDIYANANTIVNDQQTVTIGELNALPSAQHRIRITSAFRTANNSVARFRFSDNLAWYDFTNHANALAFRGAVSWGSGGQQKANWLDGTNTTAYGIALAYIRGDQLCKASKSQYVEIDLLNMGGSRILVYWNFHQHSDAGVLMHLWCKGLIDYHMPNIKRFNIMSDTGVFSKAHIQAEWI